MRVHKKINGKGGLTIPKDLRTELGLFAGQGVDLEVSDGKLLLSKHAKTCHFCGTPEDVDTLMGIDICQSCKERLKRKMEGQDDE